MQPIYVVQKPFKLMRKINECNLKYRYTYFLTKYMLCYDESNIMYKKAFLRSHYNPYKSLFSNEFGIFVCFDLRIFKRPTIFPIAGHSLLIYYHMAYKKNLHTSNEVSVVLYCAIKKFAPRNIYFMFIVLFLELPCC